MLTDLRDAIRQRYLWAREELAHARDASREGDAFGFCQAIAQMRAWRASARFFRDLAREHEEACLREMRRLERKGL